jgi:aspartyl-tRNA(Asn)/glutamyl-tRNA(Gln) amidotransferase subunit B
MQEGSFRADVNISLRPKGSKTLGVKTELKNLNSFRYIEQAIEYEIERQTALLEQGKSLEQETRTFLPKTQKTRRMRVKENENDYRYFRDPDLLPIHLTKTLINTARSTLPPLPEALQEHLFTTYQLELPEIDFLLTDPHLYQYFECTQKETLADAKSIVNWLKGPLRAKLNDLQLGFNQSPMRPASLAQLLNAIKDTKITTQQAKNIFNQFWEYKTEIDILIERLSHENSFSESTLEKIMLNIFEQYPAQVLDLKNGKDKLLGFFIGLVMRETKGNANPEVIHQILQTCLEKVPSP